MKNLAIIILILTLMIMGLTQVQTQTRRGVEARHYAPVTQWEYYKCYDIEELNDLGEWGWELVAVIPERWTTSGACDDYTKSSTVKRRLFLLKRPKG